MLGHIWQQLKGRCTPSFSLDIVVVLVVVVVVAFEKHAFGSTLLGVMEARHFFVLSV